MPSIQQRTNGSCTATMKTINEKVKENLAGFAAMIFQSRRSNQSDFCFLTIELLVSLDAVTAPSTSPLHLSLNREGSLRHNGWLHNHFLHFFSVLHCPLGFRGLQACPFLDPVLSPLFLSALSSSPLPTGSPTSGGDVTKPAELAHSFSFCSCVYFCLYRPFNCISLHKFSRQFFVFSFCSAALISVFLVLSTVYLFMKVSLSPDIILCGWLALKHQLTN